MFNVGDWATPWMTAFVFAPKKTCNRPRIAVVWSAKSDQLLNSLNGSQEVHLAHGLHQEIRHGVHHVDILCGRRQHMCPHQVAAALCS